MMCLCLRQVHVMVPLRGIHQSKAVEENKRIFLVENGLKLSAWEHQNWVMTACHHIPSTSFAPVSDKNVTSNCLSVA